MVRIQRQVHRSTAQHGKDTGVQADCFFQADPDDCGRLPRYQQGVQALLDCQCLSMQLTIGHFAGTDMQCGPVGKRMKACLQPIDQWHSGRLYHVRVGGAVEPVGECQRLKRIQAVFGPAIGDRLSLRSIRRLARSR